ARAARPPLGPHRHAGARAARSAPGRRCRGECALAACPEQAPARVSGYFLREIRLSRKQPQKPAGITGAFRLSSDGVTQTLVEFPAEKPALEWMIAQRFVANAPA